MANQKVSKDPEIHLCQILEEEYISLHKVLPRDYYEENKADNKDEADRLRLSAIYELIHKLPENEKRAAICLSGGGIRSGTFALGVLQGLARHRLLNKFHYLSTVSGGGYIGSWLSCWISREPEGLTKVAAELREYVAKSKLEPEPEPVRHLREYSNFLTPKFSMLSADVWTFVATYLRNLIINWLVLIPLILSVLAIPRLCVSIIRVAPSDDIWGWLALIFGFISGAIAIGYASINRPTAGDALKPDSFWRKHNTQQDFLWMCLVPILLSAVLLTTFWAWHPPSVTSALASNRVFSTIADWHWLRVIPRQLLGLMTFGVLMYLVAWLISSTVLRKFKVTEFVFIFPRGALSGALLWIAATKFLFNAICDPVVLNPHAYYPEDELSLRPLSEIYTCFAAPLFLVTFLLSVTLFVAISSRTLRGSPLIEDEDREWLARFGGWVLITILVWGVFSADVFFGQLAIWNLPKIIASIGGVSGLIALLAGKSSKTPANNSQAAKTGWQSVVLDHAFSLAALAFVIIFFAALALGTTLAIEALAPKFSSFPRPEAWYNNYPSILGRPFGDLHLMKITHYTPRMLVVGCIVFLTAFALMLARFAINLNKFSLHAAYRNRLIRAFLGASREERERKPNPFTGFDPSDNLQMHELRPGLLQAKSFKGWDLNDDDPNRDWGFRDFVESLIDAGQDQNQATAGKESIKADASQYIMSLIAKTSRKTMILLRNHNPGAAPTQSLKSSLIEDLNRILETELFYLTLPFDQLPVTDQTNALIHYLADPNIDPNQVPTTKSGPAIMSLISEMLLTDDERRSFEEHRQRGEKTPERLIPRPLRNIYRIALNRLLLDQVYRDEIIPCKYPLPPFKLMHVVDTALNLVHGKNLAWQQRKAESFSISPLHCGNFNLGYRRSRNYGGADGISLGTAATISGAAASSNMGYYSSSAAITFVLTLFNARLGAWLGNPGPKGEGYYRLGYPKAAIYPIIAEAFGWTDDENSYVFLSDGGHFENLGLYEMVLRRCHVIVAVDGAQDAEGKFGDIGNAVRKIRIDLGIPIEFDHVAIYPRSSKNDDKYKDGKYCAVGRIRYSCVDKVDGRGAEDGVLVYIKPAFYGNEPRDIFNYALAHEDFPHETTADQWFDEPQFESYRMLGSFIMDVIAGDDTSDLSTYQLIKKAYKHSKASIPPRSQPWLDVWLKGKGISL